MSETEYQTEQLETWSRFEIRPTVFFPAAAIIIVFVLLGAIFVDEFAHAFETAQDFINSTLGWFYIVTVSAFVVFVIILALSPYGRIKLGPDDSTPDYGYLTWFAMMFAAGMGIGLFFFSVAEPISHLAIEVPPAADVELGTDEAAREAMNVSYFHWGMHAWAVYIVVGLALTYFAYRRGLPLTVRSAFYPLLGDRIRGPIGDAIDTLAIVGTLFGVATSLGLGVFQINAGLDYVADIEPSAAVQMLLIVIITAVATVSVISGLDIGIKYLSQGTMVISGIFVAFVLIAGPTVFIMQGLVETTGYYFQNIVETSMRTDMYTDPSWQGDWTLFYWGWWISWSPFVGLFLARISRGRTVREFILSALAVPTVLSIIVFGVLGHAAFDIEFEGAGGIVEATEESLDFALFAMLEHLPFTFIASIIAIIIIAAFFVTSSDSGSLVDDIHASGGSLNPKWQTRLFWSLAEGAVAAVLLLAGGETGLEAFQQASLITGIPLGILLLMMCVGIFKALREDHAETRARERARQRSAPPRPASTGSTSSESRTDGDE